MASLSRVPHAALVVSVVAVVATVAAMAVTVVAMVVMAVTTKVATVVKATDAPVVTKTLVAKVVTAVPRYIEEHILLMMEHDNPFCFYLK